MNLAYDFMLWQSTDNIGKMTHLHSGAGQQPGIFKPNVSSSQQVIPLGHRHFL